MNRILKRPMFKMGGDVEDVGIMDGMRTRFANGAFGRKQRRAQRTTNPFFDPKTTLPNIGGSRRDRFRTIPTPLYEDFPQIDQPRFASLNTGTMSDASTGTGITSALKSGANVEMDLPKSDLKSTPSIIKGKDEGEDEGGGGGSDDKGMRAMRGFGTPSLNDFLINFGLNLVSATPRGGLLATAAESAKEPFRAMQARRLQEEALEEEREFQKELKMMDRSEIEKQARLMSNTKGNKFFNDYEGALNEILSARLKDASPFRKERNPIAVAFDNLVNEANMPITISEFAAPYQANIVKIIQKNKDIPFDTSQPPFAYKGRTDYEDGAVYIEPRNGILKRYDKKAQKFIDIGFIDPSGKVTTEQTPGE
jgi:hypothetical protein